MDKNEGNVSGKYPEEIERIVDGLTLFDDNLMSRVFENNVKATELLLRIIFNRPIKVVRVNGQAKLLSHEIDGKDIVLDILAENEDGTLMDIEVQGDAAGADVRRARYYSSMLDTKALKSGEDYKNMRDTYVIFICRQDSFEQGLQAYHISRFIEENRQRIDDGSHIVYLNGSYSGDDDFGRLMSDFHQNNYREINFPELAEGVRFFKEDEGGRADMCDAVKEYANEQSKIAEERAKIQANVNAVNVLMKNHQLSLNQALNELGITGDAKEAVEEELKKEKVS